MDISWLLIGGFVVLWATGWLLGMAYLRGGTSAVRRVLPRVAVLVLVMVVVLVVEKNVSQAFGSLTVGLVLLPVVLITLIVQIRRLRHQRVTARTAGTAEIVPPAVRRFAVLAFAVLVLGSILLSFVAARAGY